MRVGIDISFLNTLKEKQGVNRYALGFIREITKDKQKNFKFIQIFKYLVKVRKNLRIKT